MNALMVGGTKHGQVHDIPADTTIWVLQEVNADGFTTQERYVRCQYAGPGCTLTYFMERDSRSDLFSENGMTLHALALAVLDSPGHGWSDFAGVVTRT